MENIKNHPAPDQLDSFDKYPPYYGQDLELAYTPQRSVFTLWAPTASKTRLNIYSSGEGGNPEEQLEMEPSDDGTWRIAVERDLNGSFYTFQIEKEGKWLAETPGILAKAVGINGDRAAVIDWNQTNPEGWESDRAPELKMYSDIILYELHHRDFSIAPDSGIRNKGKFLALTETGTKTPEGQASGLDHLKELGVTHIHILPSFDYATVDETRLADKTYNWGYDPKNYNVPEGSYSTDPANPVTRIREFKEMVKSLHRNGMRVVLDVVYNHTASVDRSNFNLTVPGYFYRQNADGSYSDASGCGNETASEREMVRHYIVESVKFWAQEYHIDGFRFDLMGIHDIEPHPGRTVEDRPDDLYIRRRLACGRLAPASGKTGRAGSCRPNGGHRRFLRRFPRRRARQHVRRTGRRVCLREYRRALRARKIRDRGRHAASASGL